MKIETNGIILDVSSDYENTITINSICNSDEPNNVLFCDCLYGYKNKAGNTGVIDIYKYLENKLKEQAEIELKMYLEENIGNCVFKDKKDLLLASRFIDIKESYYHRNGTINYSEIFDGIVIFEKDNFKLKYDLKNNRFFEIEPQLKNIKYKYLSAYYKQEGIRGLLIKEQHKQKKTPGDFNEFVEINKFLRNKKSIRIVFESRLEICIKNNFHNELEVFDIFNEHGRYGYYVQDLRASVIENPNEIQLTFENLSINNIEFFKYGTKIYRPDKKCFEQ